MVDVGKKYHAPGDGRHEWFMKHPIRVMAIVESYVMARRKGCPPFIARVQDTLQWTPAELFNATKKAV